MQEESLGEIYYTNNDLKEFLLADPIKKNIKQNNEDFFELPEQIVIVENHLLHQEYILAGYLLNSDGTKRISVVLKDNIDAVLDIQIDDFFKTYKIKKMYPKSVIPDINMLNGVPDKITSGQHWVSKSQGNAFGYAESGTYAQDETPSEVWEVQTVIDNEVTLNLIEQEEHQSGYKNRSNAGQTLKLQKIDLVKNYILYSFGFFLSNDFYKFIDTETFVSMENKDKILMMNKNGNNEFVALDDMIKPIEKTKDVNVDILK